MIEAADISREAVEQAVRAALARILDRPETSIFLDSELEADLELDSMALIQVNIAIEEQLRVAVPAGESPESAVRTVRDLVDFVCGRFRGQEVPR